MAKSRKSASIKVFEANLERSRAFLRIFDKDRGVGQPSNDEKELLRGCVVFAVGALDAYLSDLILEIVPQYAVKSKSLNDALSQIAKSNPGMVLRLALAQDGTDRRVEFREALSDWLENKSFQGPAKVRIALEYLGCSITWPEFDDATGVATTIELSKVTKDRHVIVHNGQRPYIRRQLAEDAVTLIDSMAKLIDQRVMAAVSIA